MAPSFAGPRRRTGFWIVAIALLWVTIPCSGCAGAWQRYQESPANPMVWFRALLPPDGETFYSDQAQEIDRSLRRE